MLSLPLNTEGSRGPRHLRGVTLKPRYFWRCPVNGAGSH